MLSEKNKNQIKEIAQKENLSIITDLNNDMLNTKSYIKLKCQVCNSEISQTVSNLLDNRRAGQICQKCLKINSYKKLLLEKYNRIPYEFLTELNGDRSQEIVVRCKDCGDIIHTTVARTLMNSKLKNNNHPCKKCAYNRNYKKDENSFETELTKKFGACNYLLLEPEKFTGFNTSSKLRIKCKICGHEFTTYPSNIMNPTNGKHYCRVCNNKDRLLERMSYKERCLSVTNNKIEPLEEYIDSRTPIAHKCNVCGYGTNGEVWLKIPVKNTLRNAGCPRCTCRITESATEKEIVEYISTFYNGTVEKHNRSLLEGQEVDIYLPELNIAIEYNGLYYHSTKFKDKLYHQNKTIKLIEKGIFLISIFEDMWILKKDHIKNLIKRMILNTEDQYDYNDTITVDLNLDTPLLRKFLSNGYYIDSYTDPNSIEVSRNSNNYRIILPTDDSETLEIFDCGKAILKKINI